jgi:2-polyprenyl-6-methoxyphenol hydroxylase-like FAD-dependent oxidoreductase
MTQRGQRVLIAGGGIGGLAAAIALGLRGRRVAVLERSTFGDETGAGIQLGPNATQALRALGVLKAVEPVAFKPEAIWLFDGLSGRRLASMPLGTHADTRYGAPYLTLHRADLHAALLAACKALDSVELQSGFEVATIQQHEERVTTENADGGEIEGEALIGADGLWSAVRKSIDPQARLLFAGATASRTLLPCAGLPSPFDAPVVGLWLGPKVHLVHYPVHGGKNLNLVAVTEGGVEEQGWSQAGDPSALLSSFANWCKESKSLLDQATGWCSWSLYRLPPLPRWSEGRVALLGDAAHPVLPFLAQGAALAMEDALTLAAALDSQPDDPSAAFARYAASRQARAGRVQTLSKRFGRIYHLSGPMRLARNFILERRGEEAALARFDWLYGFGAARD